MYSGAQKKVYEYSLIKQKCQIQMVIAQYKNVAKPNHWKLSNEVSNFILAQVTPKLSAKVKM